MPCPVESRDLETRARAGSRYMLDRAAVRAVDRAAIDEYGIPGMVLMENAARGLAAEALDMLAEIASADDRSPRSPQSPRVLIVCGGGNNGGDGYAMARHLNNAGVTPILGLLREPRPGTDAATNLTICRAMNLREIAAGEVDSPVADADLIVDGIFGTGLDRAVTDDAAEVIDRINTSKRPVLAVDVPSGLDCDTGEALGAAVRADRTVTFVAVKPGMLRAKARPYIGKVVVVGIGAPIELIERYGSLIEPGGVPRA